VSSLVELSKNKTRETNTTMIAFSPSPFFLLDCGAVRHELGPRQFGKRLAVRLFDVPKDAIGTA